MALFLLYLSSMNTAPPRINPARASKTRQKLDSRRRQGERWEAASRAVADGLVRLWLNPEMAWRRWTDADSHEAPDRPPRSESGSWGAPAGIR